jgi:hypothetical protein
METQDFEAILIERVLKLSNFGRMLNYVCVILKF